MAGQCLSLDERDVSIYLRHPYDTDRELRWTTPAPVEQEYIILTYSYKQHNLEDYNWLWRITHREIFRDKVSDL